MVERKYNSTGTIISLSNFRKTLLRQGLSAILGGMNKETELREELKSLQKRQQEVLQELDVIFISECHVAIQDTFLESFPFEDLYFSLVWDCPYSPSKKCIYDHEEDFWHDFCLICGDPSERK